MELSDVDVLLLFGRLEESVLTGIDVRKAIETSSSCVLSLKEMISQTPQEVVPVVAEDLKANWPLFR